MSRRRFQTPRQYSAGELFIMGGPDQRQIEAQPCGSQTVKGSPIYSEYGLGDAAVETMQEEGRDATYIAHHLDERDRIMSGIAREVANSAAIEESRRKVARVFNEMGSSQFKLVA
ncbi:hypothetical protein HYW35_03840 [Candidatus Saccharibacteria bacterium]|nr:hypothetical protein [Candidatus Saccharibacteria bacterium]